LTQALHLLPFLQGGGGNDELQAITIRYSGGRTGGEGQEACPPLFNSIHFCSLRFLPGIARSTGQTADFKIASTATDQMPLE